MPKPEQIEIPGTERPKVKAIEDAAQDYVDVRDKRMAMTVKEVAAKTKLIETMQKHQDKLSVDGDGNRIYRFGDEVVILSDKLQVKVRAASDGGDDDED